MTQGSHSRRQSGEPEKNDSQAPPRHTKVVHYRCFLPDLTGFMSLCCAGPGYHTRIHEKVPCYVVENWRRRRDSNPRYVAVHTISSRAPSASRSPLRIVVICKDGYFTTKRDFFQRRFSRTGVFFRRSRKKSRSSAAPASASTPSVSATSWLRRPSLPIG